MLTCGILRPTHSKRPRAVGMVRVRSPFCSSIFEGIDQRPLVSTPFFAWPLPGCRLKGKAWRRCSRKGKRGLFLSDRSVSYTEQHNWSVGCRVYISQFCSERFVCRYIIMWIVRLAVSAFESSVCQRQRPGNHGVGWLSLRRRHTHIPTNSRMMSQYVPGTSRFSLCSFFSILLCYYFFQSLRMFVHSTGTGTEDRRPLF